MQIKFTETILRDANQSLIATRLPMRKFESILPVMDKAGFYSIECWGGATFDSCIRYLDEDPWERLSIMKKCMPNTKLQMLLRGQSLLGYRHYPDDVVRKFVYNSISRGIDIIRIFDALNDVNNIMVAVDETLKSGAHPSCAIAYTTSPVHTVEKYVKLAQSMEDLGAKSICIKDMAGVLYPDIAYELVTELKKKIQVPIILHSHCTTGLAYMAYLKAIEAGVDVIDTAISSFSGGTSQPATEVLANTAMSMGYDINLNMDKINTINEHFKIVYNECWENGMIDPKVTHTDTKTLESRIPGGMYSNLLALLKAQNMMHRFDDVLKEIPVVWKDMGYAPLVTPISQMVVTQAVVNVMSGERYQTIIGEVKAFFRGEYGMPPAEVNIELMKAIAGKVSFSTERYSKNLEYVYEKTKMKYTGRGYGRSQILTTILFPDLVNKFVEKRNSADKESFSYTCEEADEKVIQEMFIMSNKINTSDDIKAVIITILAHKQKITPEKININGIYEIA